MAQLNIDNFNRRIWIAGGRNQGPPGSMRRCINAAPELTGSVQSRYGSTLLYPINSISLTRFNQQRYQYDGANLYQNGVSIDTGYNGGRLAFVKMPANLSVPDYLFVTGGGRLVKVDPSGNVTNWGIQPPGNSAQAHNNANDQIVIDSFNSSAGSWTKVHNTTSIKNSSTEFITGTGSMEVDPGPFASGVTRIQRNFSAPLNLGTYANGDISLLTDIFQIWVFIDQSSGKTVNSAFIRLEFDVSDGTFKKDYYDFTIGLTNGVNFQQSQWQQFTIAKSQFSRTGTRLNFDWTNVVAIRISSGTFNNNNLFLDNLTLSGGSAMGAGPAAGNGGSEYEYYTVFKNLTTGSQSNPQPVSTRVFNVSVNKVALSQIPVSSDVQVGARDLYRTSAENTGGGQPAFYLDTIYDNTTTTYTDQISDTSFPLATTPWQKNVNVPSNGAAPYYVDAGNGYYFKLTTPGMTGANPPTWVIPTSSWSPISTFAVGTTIAPLAAGGQFYQCTTAGKSGTVMPNFGSLAPTIQDGPAATGVTWTLIGLQTTPDNGAVWTFQGINSTPVLGNQQMRLDNAAPLSTYNDAAGPFQGLMVWCRDTTPGAKGRVYYSPAGRPESVANFVDVSTDDDPTQKAVIWDRQLWVLTQQQVYPLIPFTADNGTTQLRAGDPVLGALGTSQPFSVISTQRGIIYQGPDGPRALDNGFNGLIAFDALAPVLRGQQVENIAAFSPVIAAETRGEILFSDLTTTFGLIVAQEAPVWRMIQQAMTAIYYEKETKSIVAAWGGNTYIFEDSTKFTDNGTAIALEWQTPSVLVAEGQFALVQRVYIDINCNGQTLTPTLLIDDTLTPSSFTMPNITNTQRGTVEIPFQKSAKILGLRLTGNVSQRVELFAMSMDLSPSEA